MPGLDAPITFDPEAHAYYRGDRVVPGVTEILRAVGVWPDPRLTAYGFSALRKAELGVAVHAAVALDVRGGLDEESLDPRLRPWIEAWREYWRRSLADRFEVEAVERIVWHPQHDYAGRLDLLLRAREGGDLALIDVKTGRPAPAARLQTAAYAAAWAAQTGCPPPRRRIVVELRPGAVPAYRLYCHVDDRDVDAFLSCLAVFRLQQEMVDHGVVGGSGAPRRFA